MTSRITVAAGDSRIGEILYNGRGTSKHPTDTWETSTQVNSVDGLVQLITGRLDTPHGEFWFEPDETVVVIRHPPAEPEPAIVPHKKHAHRH